MFKTYIHFALRNLWKNKAFSVLNILGLSMGLAMCLLIVLYVRDELMYDKYNDNADRIYRLQADIYFNNTQANFAVAPDPLGPALVRDYPQVQQMVRFNNQADILVKKDNQNIQEHHAVFADSTFFKLFSIPMVAGDPSDALREPNSIVIDQTIARKYFNTTDVIGKTLTIDNNVLCKITGVIRDMPSQSHFHFSFIRPKGKDQINDSWLSNNTYTYIQVRPGITKEQVQKYVDATIYNYLSKELVQQLHTSLTELRNKGSHFIYHAMPLTDIHLHSNDSYELEANGSLSSVYIFSVIAVFILLIACVNFMNLSTALSANRAKEVGIRKVAGSLRSQLITQFLTESVLLSFFSFLFAILIAITLIPLFDQVSGKQMHAGVLFSTWLLPLLLAVVLLVGIVAGSYPAFYLSSFQPVHVLKGNIAKGFKTSWLRSSLVVFQFTISIILIIGTIVIFNQINYIRNKKIGYKRDQVLVLHNPYYLGKMIRTFRDELLNIPGVNNATVTGDLPTATDFDNEGWFRDASLDPTRAVVLANFRVDENYIPTLAIQIKQGRNFSKDFPSDSTGILLNETAVNVLGIKNPFKEMLYRPNFNNENIGAPIAYHIVGIVKDFNFSSLHNKVSPLVIQWQDNQGSIAISIHSLNTTSIINTIQSRWKKMVPDQPFSYTFMDADFNNIYTSEQRTSKLFIAFVVFAILIGCLGLFGLVTYAAEQRTKEIGVRKVLGASIRSIVGLLSKDFSKLVLVASFIAFPLAWWFMNKWLQSFAYRITISWWIFVVAGLLALTIAFFTISIQAIKAAIANPVHSLRSE